MEHQIVIEQAKGVLMAGYHVKEDTALTILELTSQEAGGLEVHQVAARLLTRLSFGDAGPIGPDVLDACLAQITD